MNQKEWTIMIYMAGDNNLSVDMAYALEQIKGIAGDGPDSPNLFVYYDGSSPSIPTLYCDFSDPKRHKYVRSFMVPEKLYDVPEKPNENAADRKSMLNFVNWCLNDVEVVGPDGEITYGRRANRYAFIISGHSLGFQDIGLFKDETTGKTMKMNDLYFTLARIAATQDQLNEDAKRRLLEGLDKDRETTLLVGQKFDILGFDACVMGMLEVGYQFCEVAKTMIASEGSVPSAGWTYAKILGNLTCDKTDSNIVAERFVRNFIESQDAFTVGGVSVDMAAWDLSRMRDLATAFDNLANILIQCFSEPDHIYRQMERVILQVHWKSQSYMYDQNVDLYDFCELLDRECGMMIEEMGYTERGIINDVQDRCRDVMEKLNDVVILSGFSGGDYQYSNGISVFFPWSREGYEVSRKNYESLWFAKDAGSRKFAWMGFLRKYLNEVALRRSAPFTPDAAPGTRYRYLSGIRFEEMSDMQSFTAAASSDGRIAGERGSKIAGEIGSKIAGEKGSKIAGEVGSKIAGETGSKIAGEKGSKIAGEVGSKIAGETGSKIAGEKGSKIAGEIGSKIAGETGSKLAGGGSNAFFENLRLFKNIESRWDISGFTKRRADPVSESKEADG